MRTRRKGNRLSALLLLLIILLLAFPAAASPPAKTSPRDITEAFFQLLAAGKVAAAYDRLFAGSPIPADKPQAVQVLRQQTKNVLPLYGAVLGYDFISEKNYGQAVARLVYVLKSAKGPTVWEFYFYRPRDSWFLANVTFNDRFSLLR
ncbi:MAG: hypothetical protein JRJ56_05355 [Deltaproteobacteria bacterium]|nr:hypothetical protein [Deltaproteobacteria bacterium]